MARDLLTPQLDGVTRDLAAGLVYRKQILPKQTVNYKGQKLQFDDNYFADLVKSFNDAAYDQVTFTLATEDNRHTDSPELVRGEVTSISLANPGEPDGLYATIAFPNAEAAAAVANNPKLGVSCRILEGLAKPDGRVFPRALKHVCGTVDPYVSGMSPWRKVDLSGYDPQNELVDLSASHYTEVTVGNQTASATPALDGLDFAALSDDELKVLAKALNITDEDIATYLAEAGEPGDEDEDADEADETDEDADEDDTNPAGQLVAAGAASGADLTAVEGQIVDLAARQVATAARQAADEALGAMAQAAWDSRRRELLGSGVPAHLVDLCEPVFNRAHGLTIDLSNGDGDDALDVQAVVGQLLEGMAGYVDLANETGHGGQFRAAASEADPDEALLNQWSTEYGR